MPSGLPSLDQITPEYLLDLPASEFARLVRMYWPPEPEELVAWHLLWSTLRGHQDLRRKGLRVLDEELDRCQVEIAALRRRMPVDDGVMRGPNGYVSLMRDARTRLSAPDGEDPVPPAPCPDHEPLPAAAELTPGRLCELSEEQLRKLLLDHLLPNPESPDSWRTLWAWLHREPSLQARASVLLRAEFAEAGQVLRTLEELGFSPRKDPLWRGPRLLARSLREGLDRLRHGPTADRRTNWQSSFDVSYVRDQVHLHVGSHRQDRANVGCAADRRLWGCLESVPHEDWAALHFLIEALLDHRDVLTGGGGERSPERDDLLLWAALHEYSVDDGSGTRRPIRRLAPLVRRRSPLERLTDLRHAVRDHRQPTVRPRPPDETLWTATSAVLSAEALLGEVDPRSLMIDAVRSVQEHRDAVWASHRATSTDVMLWSALKWQVVWDATAKAVSLDSIHPRPADHPLTLMWACFYDIYDREFAIIGIEQEEVWQLFGPIVEDSSVPPGRRHERIIAELDRRRRPA
ncbi:hypothetical protein B4N89_45070 [Embleya scabrispora]|uniref:Uncharacterized protein n=1 Tax=Embleya scabrispora TaxID=159449 RepID=A0A1T3NIL5_9ACTN|nr:hypothetical protein [Embleya scabrispora]OPC76664.1 hypothetical protein B4N89_45070 [Embleya scabrispora]